MVAAQCHHRPLPFGRLVGRLFWGSGGRDAALRGFRRMGNLNQDGGEKEAREAENQLLSLHVLVRSSIWAFLTHRADDGGGECTFRTSPF